LTNVVQCLNLRSQRHVRWGTAERSVGCLRLLLLERQIRQIFLRALHRGPDVIRVVVADATLIKASGGYRATCAPLVSR